jgi:hypothetical protein
MIAKGMSRMALPHFFIAGVPKAGTTGLYAALVRHPQLYLPSVKEPKFFLSDGRPPRHGGPGDVQTYQGHVWRRADYEALFDAAPADALRGEATPFYLYDRDAHQRIRRLVPDAKFILVLRDPVDRAYSNWSHLWSAGLEKESDFLAACDREQRRHTEGWADFWHYLGLGLYGGQVRDLQGEFGRDQVLVMRYRDLRDEPITTLDRVCRFLGVATGVIHDVPPENVRAYVADSPLNAVVRFALRNGARVGQHFPAAARRAASGPLLALLHRSRQGYRNDSGRRRPRLTPDQRAQLVPYFADDIRLLESVTGNSYADWLTEHHLTTVDATASRDGDRITVDTPSAITHGAATRGAVTPGAATPGAVGRPTAGTGTQ